MLATGNFESDTARALTEGGQGGLAIYQLAARHQLTPGTSNLGTVRAVSAETGRTEWLFETRAGTMSLVATAAAWYLGAMRMEDSELLTMNLGKSYGKLI